MPTDTETQRCRSSGTWMRPHPDLTHTHRDTHTDSLPLQLYHTLIHTQALLCPWRGVCVGHFSFLGWGAGPIPHSIPISRVLPG